MALRLKIWAFRVTGKRSHAAAIGVLDYRRKLTDVTLSAIGKLAWLIPHFKKLFNHGYWSIHVLVQTNLVQCFVKEKPRIK